MFKYFNPIWLIKNFLQPSLGPEILVPAAIGAVGSGVMGGNPIKGALLGGATGGILGGAGGAGSNLFSGFKSALPTGLQGTSAAVAPSLGSGGYAAFAPAATQTVASNVANPILSNASNMGNIGMANTFNTGASNISNVAMATPEYVNPALITNPSQLPPPAPQTYTDGVADVIRPRFDEPIRVTEQATKTGGYETPFYEKTFNSILNYAQKNPLDIAGVGLVASGKIGPKAPPLQPRDANIIKGTTPQLGQLLQVRRPTRFS